MNEPNNIAATVFVYCHKVTGEVVRTPEPYPWVGVKVADFPRPDRCLRNQTGDVA